LIFSRQKEATKYVVRTLLLLLSAFFSAALCELCG